MTYRVVQVAPQDGGEPQQVITHNPFPTATPGTHVAQVSCHRCRTNQTVNQPDFQWLSTAGQMQEIPGGGGNPKGRAANLLFGILFAENCMKMKMDVPFAPRFATVEDI